jgi:hypothetical protein
MIRNTLIAAAAVVMFAVAPAQAGAIYSGAPIVEENSNIQEVRHWVRKCRIVRIKTYYGWRNVQQCRRVRGKHYNSY